MKIEMPGGEVIDVPTANQKAKVPKVHTFIACEHGRDVTTPEGCWECNRLTTTESKGPTMNDTAKTDPPRTLATVAAELQTAIAAKDSIPALRRELDRLLGKKARKPKAP